MSVIKEALIQLRMQMELANIKEILKAPYISAQMVISAKEQPEHVCLVYMRNYLRLLGLWPLKADETNKFYTFYNAIIRILLIIFFLTAATDLYEASNDVVLFGEDLMILLAFALVQLRIHNIHFNIDEIDMIIAEFDVLHQNIASFNCDNFKIHRSQRLFFTVEIVIFSVSCISGYLFSLFYLVSAIYTNQPLLTRAKFPFGLHDPVRHPYCVDVIFIFQYCCVLFGVPAIFLMDQLIFQAFSQIVMNLKFLCLRISQLGRLGDNENDMWTEFRDIIKLHQQIIRLTYKINKYYRWSFISQITCSTLMICLSAFEITVTQDQPTAALKFQLFMGCCFGQLLMLCWMGNMVYYNSQEVAAAAFEIHKWYEKSSKFQRNLMFFIKRAQNPLQFHAKPFYPLTVESFTKILGKSYSAFALLRTMND